jgi:5-deoxy-glucuronate isomerase
LEIEGGVFKTPTEIGYHKVITTENSALQYLSYHRLVLAPGASHVLEESGQETGCLCMACGGRLSTGENLFNVGVGDCLYVPCGSRCEIENTGDNFFDVVLSLARCSTKTEYALVSNQEIVTDGRYHRTVGVEPYKREVFTVIGPEIAAERLLLGYTISGRGQWTSWPPHEHIQSQEEIYLYFDSGKLGFSIQLISSNLEAGGFCRQVYDGDAVVVSHGFHPTVSAPNCTSKYIWMIAAKEPRYRRTDIAQVRKDYV